MQNPRSQWGLKRDKTSAKLAKALHPKKWIIWWPPKGRRLKNLLKHISSHVDNSRSPRTNEFALPESSPYITSICHIQQQATWYAVKKTSMNHIPTGSGFSPFSTGGNWEPWWTTMLPHSPVLPTSILPVYMCWYYFLYKILNSDTSKPSPYWQVWGCSCYAIDRRSYFDRNNTQCIEDYWTLLNYILSIIF